MQLQLDTAEGAVALRAIEHAANDPDEVPVELSLEQRLVEHLASATAPLTATALRKLCQVRNTALHRALAALVDAGTVRKDRAGYALAR